MTEEAAAFERILRAQQEAEKRRFHPMQAQQQATNQMFLQIMGTLASALHPGQPHSSTIPPWTTTPPSTSAPSAWSMPQLYQPTQPTDLPPMLTPHQHQAQSPSPQTEHPNTSSILHEIHSKPDYCCNTFFFFIKLGKLCLCRPLMHTFITCIV